MTETVSAALGPAGQGPRLSESMICTDLPVDVYSLVILSFRNLQCASLLTPHRDQEQLRTVQIVLFLRCNQAQWDPTYVDASPSH